jgi:hypothetical protein
MAISDQRLAGWRRVASCKLRVASGELDSSGRTRQNWTRWEERLHSVLLALRLLSISQFRCIWLPTATPSNCSLLAAASHDSRTSPGRLPRSTPPAPTTLPALPAPLPSSTFFVALIGIAPPSHPIPIPSQSISIHPNPPQSIPIHPNPSRSIRSHTSTPSRPSILVHCSGPQILGSSTSFPLSLLHSHCSAHSSRNNPKPVGRCIPWPPCIRQHTPLRRSPPRRARREGGSCPLSR